MAGEDLLFQVPKVEQRASQERQSELSEFLLYGSPFSSTWSMYCSQNPYV